MSVYSHSRNDVPRATQRYGTIAAHTRRRVSVLVVFEVFCVHMYSWAGLIRWTPPPTFSDTAVTDRHSDTTIFQLRAHWMQISWSIGSEKSFGHVPPVGVEPSTSCARLSAGGILRWLAVFKWTISLGKRHLLHVFTHIKQGWQKDGKYSYFPGRREILVIPGKYW